jgi:toxin secretion/phage lysis holin
MEDKMKENLLKALISAAVAAFAVYMQSLIVPIVILISFMILDYVTGMAAAWRGSELSSRIGITGIVKKVLYLVVVAVGVGVDYIIGLAGGLFGYDLSKVFAVALIVVVWLILNEFISIVENLDEIGVPVPHFLCTIIEKLKKKTEEKTEGKPEGNTEDKDDN